MTRRGRAWTAVAALFAVLAVTASWWALALWPVPADTPDWVLRTRQVCFGATASSLPDATGWMVLIGQPVGLILLLAVVWRAELREGLGLLLARFAGQVALGAVSAALVVGLGGVFARVSAGGGEPFDTGAVPTAAALTRINDVPPALALTDQFGQQVDLASLRGKRVLVTFAYAHCETICPALVHDVLAAQREAGELAPEVLVVTLDPWRDTPRRLAAIAERWRLPSGARVLSGEPEAVERTLNAWRIPRTRNERTGDIIHPSVVYVIAPNGRIAYVVTGGPAAIAAAVRGV